MKNLKIYLPIVLAIALGCTFTTCTNDAARKEYEREQDRPRIEIPSGEDFYTPTEDIEDQIANIGMHK